MKLFVTFCRKYEKPQNLKIICTKINQVKAIPDEFTLRMTPTTRLCKLNQLKQIVFILLQRCVLEMIEWQRNFVILRIGKATTRQKITHVLIHDKKFILKKFLNLFR